MTKKTFLDKVTDALTEFDMITSGDTVYAALSGGADSVSLLYALKSLAGEAGIEVRACHVNHGLRGEESDADERFCAELCDALGVSLEVRRISVRSLMEKHESVEECARKARYAFFEEILSRDGGYKLATAHSADDSAETVLMNLMRGTGLKGLCGIPPVRGRIIRPIIFCSRGEVEGFCAENGLKYVTDSTNLCDDYTRNKVRHIILPEMRKINGSLLETLTRMEGSLREDSDYLESTALRCLEQAREGRGWNAAKLCALPAPLKNRAVKKILSDGGIEPSALRINTAAALLEKRSARFNPCRDRFFTIRKGICFVEEIQQHYRKHS